MADRKFRRDSLTYQKIVLPSKLGLEDVWVRKY